MHTHSEGEFVRHRGPITCVAGIPNSSQVVTCGYDGAVAVYDLENRQVELLGYHKHLVNRVSINAAGTKAASSSSDYTILLWDLQARRMERVLRGHSDDVEDFVFIDESMGASVSRDWRVLVWNLENGSIVNVLEGHEKDALSVAYYNGSLFTSGDDMTLRVWDLRTGRQRQIWGPFDSETDTCAIDPLHNRVVLGCDDGIIRVFSIATGEQMAGIAAHRSGIKKVAVSPANGDILSAAYDQKICLWDAGDFTEKVRLEGHPSLWERSFNWSPEGTHIFAGTFDGTVLQWEAAGGERLAEIGDQEHVKGNACFNEVSAAAGGEMALVSDDGYVRLARLTPDRSEWIARIEPASGRVLMNAVTLDERSNRVICGAHNHTLHLFDRANGGLHNEIAVALGEGPINSIRAAQHPGWEGVAFVGCYSGAIVAVAPDGHILQTFRIHENAVKALRLHPQKPLGVSCSADGILVSWDLCGRALHRFLGPTAIVDDVDIDPTGQYIAAVGRDFTLRVYDLEEARLLYTFSLGRRSPKGLCFFDEETILVTNYWGELLKVSLPTAQVLRRQVACNGISSAARSGEYLAVTSYDGAVYLVRPDDLGVVQCLRAMTQKVAEPIYV